MEPLDGELALGSHWVVKSKAEILKIVKVIACVIGFGVPCAAMGIPVTYLVISMSNDPAAGFGFFAIGISFMSVFGILGAALEATLATGSPAARTSSSTPSLTAHLGGTDGRLTVNWQWRLIGLL